MHERQTHEPSPEELIIQQLSVDADRALEQYGSVVEPDLLPDGFGGTMDRAAAPQGSHLLTRTTSPDGQVSYDLASLWRSSSDRGASSYRWGLGGNQITARSTSEVQGETAEQPIEDESTPRVAEELNTAFPHKPAETPRRLFGGRRSQPGRHRAGAVRRAPQAETVTRQESGGDTGIDEGGQERTPERRAVQNLNATARGILDAAVPHYEMDRDGSRVRAYHEGKYGPQLIERVDAEGKRSYGFTYTIGPEAAKAGASHVWLEGGHEVHVQFEGIAGSKYDTLLENPDDIDVVQGNVRALAAPVDRATSYQGPLPEGMIRRLQTAHPTVRDRQDLLTATPNRYPQPKPEKSDYNSVLERATTQIDTLADDPTVKWKAGKSTPNRRTVQALLPDSRPGYSDIAAEITIIDEPDTPRWYVVTMKAPSGNARAITWSKGRERALVRTPGSDEYRVASGKELGLAADATDPERAVVARRPPELSPERYAQLTRTQRVAHRIGRLFGSRTVTGFW
ncbi:MAG TPA: hypothetical protein VFT16_01750 [Candidatus Saccharimonadales bacterium]|nr:hypothetical protein [Candidatus Saccharimonadales bacterium]